MKSICKKLGAISLLTFSLLFCGAFNKCEAKTVTALVVKENEHVLEKKFFEEIIKAVKSYISGQDIDLVLTDYEKRNNNEAYNFLIYIKYSESLLDNIPDDGLFCSLIKSDGVKVKNVIWCSIKQENSEFFADLVGSTSKFNPAYIEDVFVKHDVNKFISPARTHDQKHVLRISKDNSFGLYYTFYDEGLKDETKRLIEKTNQDAHSNLAHFIIKRSECKKPIKYWFEKNPAYIYKKKPKKWWQKQLSMLKWFLWL
jgi:hypothetical protein